MSDSPNRYNEIDFLSALLAFQAGHVSPEAFRKAIQNYSDSTDSTLCENVEAVAGVELDDYVVMARKRLSAFSVAGLSPGEVRPTSTDDPASSAMTAQTHVTWEDDEAEHAEAHDWEPKNEFWSHVFYVDDVIRSYTAGWIGLGGTGCIAGAIVAIIWAALAFPSTGVLNITVPNAGPVAGADTQSQEEVSGERAAAQAENSPVVLASTEDKGQLDSPISSSPDSARDATAAQAPIDLDPVVDLIEESDLQAALIRLEEIRNDSTDEACERLAIGIRLEMETDSSVQDAGERIAALQDFDNPAATLLFCRWAIKATPEQQMELYERFQADKEKKLAVRWLSSLCGGELNAIRELSVSADNLKAIPTALFLAWAHYRSADRQQALEQLDALEQQLKEPKSWFAEDRSERWLMASSIAAISREASQLRSQLEIRKSK